MLFLSVTNIIQLCTLKYSSLSRFPSSSPLLANISYPYRFSYSQTCISQNKGILLWSSLFKFSSSFARLPAKERETLKVSTQRYQKDMKRANILIYKAPKGTYTKMVLWQFAAALQLTFWANLTDIYWRVSKESDNSNASPEKSTLPKRVLIIGGMALVAVGIASVMLIIPARTIMSMKILKNGITAQLETGRSIPWGRTRNIPLKNLTTNELLCNGLGQSGIDSKAKLNAPIFIRAKDEQLAYMLDRNGNYENPKLFDALFYEPPTNKKP